MANFITKEMKRYIFLCFALIMLATSCKIHCKEVKFIDDGKSSFKIIIDKESTELVFHSASELQKYINQISGVKLPIIKREGTENSIVLSEDNCSYVPDKDTIESLNTDGFLIKRVDKSLVISSPNDRGLLYGVYTFLEEHLGCRWYSSSVKKIPSKKTIILDNIYNRQSPKVKYREVYYFDVCDPDLAAQLKLNGNAQKKGKIGDNRNVIQGGRHAGWGMWCHTLYSLVSPELYDTHPEYFSLIKGKREKPQGHNTQLCFSNPELSKTIIESLKKKMKHAPSDLPVWADKEDYYWSVSQMDGNGNCECEECRKLDQKEGTPMGSILPVINEIARQFPDKKIATLAYIYSRKAPRFVNPEENVAIQLCAIETARDGINLPVGSSEIHKTFRDDLVAWGKICNDITIWDYEVQFQNLVSPFPNFQTMQDNILFYTKNNVSGIFCQGNREKGGEFCDLRAYVLAKLLWNPDCDLDAVINDFIHGYYGEAGSFIRKYFDLLHAKLEQSGLTLSMDGEPEHHSEGYLSKESIGLYKKLFDQAEMAVKDKPEVLLRVKEARMPIMYAQLKLKYGTEDERKNIAADFLKIGERTNLWMLSEVDCRVDQSGTREMFKKKIEAELKVVF